MKLTQANIDCFNLIGGICTRMWNEGELWKYPKGHDARADYDYGDLILERMAMASVVESRV